MDPEPATRKYPVDLWKEPWIQMGVPTTDASDITDITPPKIHKKWVKGVGFQRQKSDAAIRPESPNLIPHELPTTDQGGPKEVIKIMDADTAVSTPVDNYMAGLRKLPIAPEEEHEDAELAILEDQAAAQRGSLSTPTRRNLVRLTKKPPPIFDASSLNMIEKASRPTTGPSILISVDDDSNGSISVLQALADARTEGPRKKEKEAARPEV